MGLPVKGSERRLPNEVRRLRRLANLSMATLAARVGVTEGMIGHVEVGRDLGSPRLRHAIVAALREELGEFVTYAAVFPPEREAAWHGWGGYERVAS